MAYEPTLQKYQLKSSKRFEPKTINYGSFPQKGGWVIHICQKLNDINWGQRLHMPFYTKRGGLDKKI